MSSSDTVTNMCNDMIVRLNLHKKGSGDCRILFYFGDTGIDSIAVIDDGHIE